jgi:DHA1 family multidrug resistance protein-like MFS transporter
MSVSFYVFMRQRTMRGVRPLCVLSAHEIVGIRPGLLTLGGLAFSFTGLAGMVAVPLLGKHSDEIGYRRVLLICLAGATLTSLPQAFAYSYWAFAVERFGVGLFIGGILPTANALIGRMVSRGERGTIYGLTASATFLGNSMGPLTGGAIAASFGLRWVFLITAALLLANLVWVYFTVPEYVDERG